MSERVPEFPSGSFDLEKATERLAQEALDAAQPWLDLEYPLTEEERQSMPTKDEVLHKLYTVLAARGGKGHRPSDRIDEVREAIYLIEKMYGEWEPK